MTNVWPRSLLIVGCGNMGGAMLQGWLAGGLDPSSVTVIDPVLESAPQGVTLFKSGSELAEGFMPDALLLGIKPQLLDQVGPSLVPLVNGQTIVLSMLAGVELDTLQARFPGAKGYVRLMPNLSAAIGKSPVGLAASGGLADAERDAVLAFMQPLGTPQWIDEQHFDLVTALVGSGPAFVYRFIDALAAGAVELGLPQEQAEALAIAMVEGGAQLASSSPYGPGELADRVASPGGTTRAGLDVLDSENSLFRLVESTLRAARDRGAEMAREARK